MSNFLKSFSSVGKSKERNANDSKPKGKKLFQKKNTSTMIENTYDDGRQVLATQTDQINQEEKLVINFKLPQGHDSRNAPNQSIYGVNSHQAVNHQNSMMI